MSNSLRNALLVGLAFIFLAGTYVKVDSAEEPKVKVVEKREYYSVSNPGPRVLESIGKEGWDLVSVDSTREGSVISYYFQRIVSE
jgi:hypothetical protein